MCSFQKWGTPKAPKKGKFCVIGSPQHMYPALGNSHISDESHLGSRIHHTCKALLGKSIMATGNCSGFRDNGKENGNYYIIGSYRDI